MHLVRAVLLRLRSKKNVELKETDLSPDDYNMKDINDRVLKAIMRTGKTRVEVADLYGMDTSLPLAMQPPEKVPRPTMENVVKLAVFLGVSVRWILHGEPENEVDLFVMSQQSAGMTSHTAQAASASQGAAIINGANNSTVVVQNITGESLSELEREVIKAIRQLPVREQASVASYVFAIEEKAATE